MKISSSLLVGITGLILIMSMGPSWGQVPPTNDTSLGTNTGGGTRALTSSIGDENTAYGFEALLGSSGDNNAAFGFRALANGDGDDNTAIGGQALAGQTGVFINRNTAVGAFALSILGSGGLVFGPGENNIAIGHQAGSNLTTGSDNIYLSARGLANESDTIRLGRNQQQTFIAGIHTVEMSNARTVVINPTTLQLGVAPLTPSSARYKQDIETMGIRSQGLLQLRPVTFTYKQDERRKQQYGLIAEEVAEVYPEELVTRSENGEIESVRYPVLIPMLLNELQRQQSQLGTQVDELIMLKAENEQLRAIVVQQQERDAALAARLDRLEAAVASEATLASR
jgi:Chaperone of endosialidase